MGFGKELFGFIAEPLKNAHAIFRMKHCFVLMFLSSLASSVHTFICQNVSTFIHKYISTFICQYRLTAFFLQSRAQTAIFSTTQPWYYIHTFRCSYVNTFIHQYVSMFIRQYVLTASLQSRLQYATTCSNVY